MGNSEALVLLEEETHAPLQAAPAFLSYQKKKKKKKKNKKKKKKMIMMKMNKATVNIRQGLKK